MRSFEKLRERAAISPAAACRLCELAYEFESEALCPSLQFVLLVLRGLLARAYPQVERRAAHCNSGRHSGIVAPVLLVRLGGIAVALRRDAPISRCHFAATSGGDSGVFRGMLRRQLCIFTMRETRRNPANWWPQRDSNPCLVAVTFLPAVSRGSRHD